MPLQWFPLVNPSGRPLFWQASWLVAWWWQVSCHNGIGAAQLMRSWHMDANKISDSHSTSRQAEYFFSAFKSNLFPPPAVHNNVCPWWFMKPVCLIIFLHIFNDLQFTGKDWNLRIVFQPSDWGNVNLHLKWLKDEIRFRKERYVCTRTNLNNNVILIN